MFLQKLKNLDGKLSMVWFREEGYLLTDMLKFLPSVLFVIPDVKT
jgi:hypothetical protein